MNAKIKEILASKGTNVWTISSESTVYDAIEMMAEKSVGALAVTSDSKLAGIISERDYARKVILKGLASKDISVKDIMSKNVICVSPEQKVDECMAVMTEKHVRHLPVMEAETLVGMISVGDLVKDIIKEQSFTIEQLESYIRGG